MMTFPFREEPPLDFSNPQVRKEFVEKDANDERALLQKEFSVNLEEQTLLQKRLDLVRDAINSVPATDPEYTKLIIQLRMDQVELDELKVRQLELGEKLEIPPKTGPE